MENYTKLTEFKAKSSVGFGISRHKKEIRNHSFAQDNTLIASQGAAIWLIMNECFL